MASPSKRCEVLASHAVSADTVDVMTGTTAEIGYLNSDGSLNPVRMSVANGRGLGHTLERDGFTLSRLPFHNVEDVDFYDIWKCSAALYPLAEEVLQREFPSCRRVFVFDHVTRNKARAALEDATGQQRTPMLANGYAGHVHGDYTVRSGHTRARQLFAPHETVDRIDAALAGRTLKCHVQGSACAQRCKSRTHKHQFCCGSVFAHMFLSSLVCVWHSDRARQTNKPFPMLAGVIWFSDAMCLGTLVSSVAAFPRDEVFRSGACHRSCAHLQHTACSRITLMS